MSALSGPERALVLFRELRRKQNGRKNIGGRGRGDRIETEGGEEWEMQIV
jgi:hypothetical protein